MTSHAYNPKFILTVKVTVDPLNASVFLEHLKSIQWTVLVEPDCLFFVIGESQAEAGVFQWTEGWAKNSEWMMNVRSALV